ncbi:MAG: hypothetical protein L6Q77_10095 [Bacteroidetes bacterium]|nr:hypothetical protein [Bacteroidota bacterium]
MVVVIPCYAEPEPEKTLLSLISCENPGCETAVLFVINRPEGESPEKIRLNEDAGIKLEQCRKLLPDWLSLTILVPPPFHSSIAGPGSARKTGMDEAVRWFSETGQTNGILISLDADSLVSPNYLTAIRSRFQVPGTRGCSVYFEHPLTGGPEREAIVRYELHLRVFIHFQRLAGYPFAFQTIGSAFAIRADVYARAGGMNKRKAGEDFYFLHKIIPDGGFSDLTGTTVFPSARKSDRVPFGTGKAVSDYLTAGDSDYPTYHPDIFLTLAELVSSGRTWAELPQEVRLASAGKLPQILQPGREQRKLDEVLLEISRNSSSPDAFKKRFFKWLDGFEFLKWVHLLRDHPFGKIPVGEAAVTLLRKRNIPCLPGPAELESLLTLFREIDRQNRFPAPGL